MGWSQDHGPRRRPGVCGFVHGVRHHCARAGERGGHRGQGEVYSHAMPATYVLVDSHTRPVTCPVPHIPPPALPQFIKRNGQRFTGLLRYRSVVHAGCVATVLSIIPLPPSRYVRAPEPGTSSLPLRPTALPIGVGGPSGHGHGSCHPLEVPEMRKSGWVETVFDKELAEDDLLDPVTEVSR